VVEIAEVPLDTVRRADLREIVESMPNKGVNMVQPP